MFSSRIVPRPRVRTLVPLVVLACASPAFAASGSWSTTGPHGGEVNHLIGYEAGPGTLWASGSGGLFRSTSGGASWQRLSNGLPDSAYVWGLDASTSSPVLYASSRAQLFRSGNGGDLWITVGTPPAAGSIVDLSVRRGTADSLAILTPAGAWVSTNGGSTWNGTTLVPAPYRTIEFAADGKLYIGLEGSDPAVHGGAVLLESTTGGASWTPVALPSAPWQASLLTTSPADPQRLFVSDGAIVLTSADAGASWASVATPVGCGRIWTLAPHPGLAAGLFVGCGDIGVAATTNVAAPAWTTWGVATGLTINGDDPLEATAIQVHPAWPATPTLHVGTVSGGLLRSTDGGASWSAINHGYEASWIRALAVHPLDTGSGAVVLAGYGDTFTTTRAISKSPDGGTTWAPSHTGLEAEQVRGLTIDPTTVDADPFTAEAFTLYAAGRSAPIPDETALDGGLYKSTDAGATWTTIDNGIALVNGVRTMGTARAVVADPRSCAVPPPVGPCAAGSGPLQTLFAIGSGVISTGPGLPYRSARIYRSTNAGASWTARENGLPLPQDIDPGPGVALVGSIGVALAIDPTDTQTMYAGTAIGGPLFEPGMLEPTHANGVFKSVDAGATWVHASNGLPRYFGPASSHRDVLALAINPANPLVVYAAVSAFLPDGVVGRVYRSNDGGSTWFEASTGIAGQDVRALLVDGADPAGDTIYAATGGNGADRGGVYRSGDGGATWNSISIGLPAYSSTALAMPPRGAGSPARILAGTNAGVWDFTEVPDEDADGAPSSVENGVLAGDGNQDGTPDAQQSGVASLTTSGAAGVMHPAGSSTSVTIAIAPAAACTRLNDSINQPASLFPTDPLGDAGSHDPWGLVNFALPGCAATTIRVTFHGASFGPGWVWRNYGPRVPGDETTFGWYSFAGARRVDAQSWDLVLDAGRQGNYRGDPSNILFIGGPAFLPDLLFDNGFE